MAKIPDIPSTEDVPVGSLTWLKNWLDLIRLWVQSRDPQNTLVGDPLDKFTTRSELVSLGLMARGTDGTFQVGSAGGGTTTIITSGGGTGTGSTYTPDLTPPPSPTGLAVAPGIAFINITIDAPTYTQGHGNGRTLIYGAIWVTGAAEPTFADTRTKLIDSMPSTDTICSHATEPNTRWCIWAVFETVDGVNGIASGHIAGGTHGVQATTGQDVTALLAILTGQIQASQLYSGLSSRIDLVDAASGAIGSVNYRIAQSAATLTSSYTAADSATLASANTYVGTYAYSKSTVDGALTAQFSSLTANYINADTAAVASAAAYTNTYAYSLSSGTALAGSVSTLTARSTRVVNYRVQAKGYLSSVGESTLRAEDGSLLMGGSRSYNLVVLNGSTGAVESTQFYDVTGAGAFSSGRSAATLATDLNAIDATKVVIVFTQDEPLTNLTSSSLLAALKRCGATQSTLDRIKYRGAYILVGVPGTGEGSGIERYAGDVDSSTAAWVDLALQLVNGRPVGMAGQPAVAQMQISLQAEGTARAGADGQLFAQYTVKIDSNGTVTGYGLASDSTSTAGQRSSFAVRADQFYVAPATTFSQESAPAGTSVGQLWFRPSTQVTTTWNGSSWQPYTTSFPFIVQTVPTTINGQAVPAGTYIDTAMIRDGTIVNAKIGNATIDDAKIATLSATKITAGSMQVGSYIQSTGFTSGSVGWKISADGNAEFNNGVFRGSLSAATGTFSGALSGATGTFAGSLSGATGTFSGSLSAASGSFTGQVTATSGAIGGITIGAHALQSSNFVSGSSGFQVTDTGAAEFFSVTIRQPVIDAFVTTITGGDISILGGGANPYGAAVYGTRSVSVVSGGRAPFEYFWVVDNGGTLLGTGGAMFGNLSQVYPRTASNASSIQIGGWGDGWINQARVACFVKDANGRVSYSTIHVAAQHDLNAGGGGGGDGGSI
jgi:hypothetical protein